MATKQDNKLYGIELPDVSVIAKSAKDNSEFCDSLVKRAAELDAEVKAVVKERKAATSESEKKALNDKRTELQREKDLALIKAKALEKAADSYSDLYKKVSGETLDSYRKTERLQEYKKLTAEECRDMVTKLYAGKKVSKKAVAVKAPAKKAVEKKETVKKTEEKKPVAEKAAKKAEEKKVAGKKPAEKKATAKKTAEKKTVAKSAEKKTEKKTVAKKAPAKKKEEKVEVSYVIEPTYRTIYGAEYKKEAKEEVKEEVKPEVKQETAPVADEKTVAAPEKKKSGAVRAVIELLVAIAIVGFVVAKFTIL